MGFCRLHSQISVFTTDPIARDSFFIFRNHNVKILSSHSIPCLSAPLYNTENGFEWCVWARFFKVPHLVVNSKFEERLIRVSSWPGLKWFSGGITGILRILKEFKGFEGLRIFEGDQDWCEDLGLERWRSFCRLALSQRQRKRERTWMPSTPCVKALHTNWRCLSMVFFFLINK